MTIPVEEADNVGVALMGGAPCNEGGGSVAVTSAISCTHTNTRTHTHTQGKGREEQHMNNDNNDTAVVSQVTVH